MADSDYTTRRRAPLVSRIDNPLAHLIESLRISNDLTERQLAKDAGMSSNHLNGWMHGRKRFSHDMLTRVLNVFKLAPTITITVGAKPRVRIKAYSVAVTY